MCVKLSYLTNSRYLISQEIEENKLIMCFYLRKFESFDLLFRIVFSSLAFVGLFDPLNPYFL